MAQVSTCATQRARSEEACAHVRAKVAERGWTEELEYLALLLVVMELLYG